jgi:hypothetical protein
MAPLVPGLLLWLFHTYGKTTKAECQTKPVSTSMVQNNRLSFGFSIQVMDHQAKQRRIHFILARGREGERTKMIRMFIVVCNGQGSRPLIHRFSWSNVTRYGLLTFCSSKRSSSGWHIADLLIFGAIF